jgi:1-deoxy-D-xylulose-5-phosphate synthase
MSLDHRAEAAPSIDSTAPPSSAATAANAPLEAQHSLFSDSRPLLPRIAEPEDLRWLGQSQLPQVAAEIRDYLVHSVSQSGGHFASGLGAVELTIALHYVFDTPRDQLVWDVGHQCYPHKIITGRRHSLPQIRREGGLSGFLRRDESAYDAFGAGHSSTSISAALGMAIANAALDLDRKAVAIIGDGGLTAGLAFEALDHAGEIGADLLVVLNDNGMSISPNVGALTQYLARACAHLPQGAQRAAQRKPSAVSRLAKWRNVVSLAKQSGAQSPTAAHFFEALGFAYTGPVDGHDVRALVDTLRSLRRAGGPRLLHVVTQKGFGYERAAADPVKYHGVTDFDPALGLVKGKAASANYTDVFSDWLHKVAAQDRRVIAVTPAMREGSGLVRFAAEFPSRYFDVGIAEQHSVTFAAGAAAQGLKPVVAIYSTFLQRAYDQLIHDVALQRLPVLFAIDRAGLVGPDGATHNGHLDLTYLRCVPNIVVMTPTDGIEMRDMLLTGYEHDGPAAVRYPRAAALGDDSAHVPQCIPIGTSQSRRRGKRVALLVFGTLLSVAMEAAEQIDATVINMRFVKPIDSQAILETADSHELLVTIEENVIAGGAGSAVGECLAASGRATPLLHLGLPDRVLEHGTREQVLRAAGLTSDQIVTAIRARL